MITGSIHQEDIIIVNKYILIIGSPKKYKRILKDLKGNVDNNRTVVGELSISQFQQCRDYLAKIINKLTLNLKYTLCEMDPMDKYRTFHPQSI